MYVYVCFPGANARFCCNYEGNVIAFYDDRLLKLLTCVMHERDAALCVHVGRGLQAADGSTLNPFP